MEQEKALAERLPVDVTQRPIETLAPADALGRAALSGIRQLIRIVEQPLLMDLSDGNAALHLKQQRLVGDMAVAAGKLYMRAAEAEFASRRLDQIGEILARLDQVREGGEEKG